MVLNEDQTLTLSRNEAISIARDLSRRYKRFKNNAEWYRSYINKGVLPAHRVDYFQRQLEKYTLKADLFRDWNNIYELLYRSKRLK